MVWSTVGAENQLEPATAPRQRQTYEKPRFLDFKVAQGHLAPIPGDPKPYMKNLINFRKDFLGPWRVAGHPVKTGQELPMKRLHRFEPTPCAKQWRPRRPLKKAARTFFSETAELPLPRLNRRTGKHRARNSICWCEAKRGQSSQHRAREGLQTASQV